MPKLETMEMEQEDKDNPEVLTGDEKMRLTIAFITSRGKQGVSSDEICTLLGKVNGIKLLNTAVDLVLQGRIQIDVTEDDIAFEIPTDSSKYQAEFHEAMATMGSVDWPSVD